MSALSDSELVEQYRQGREAAFNEIVLRYQEKIYWVVRRFLNDHDESDDIVQDVFVKASSALKEFRGDSSLYTWLYRIAVNLSLNEIRRKRVKEFFRLDEVEESEVASDNTADGFTEVNEDQKLIRNAVAQLPPKQRIVFVLRFYEEMPYEEIAEIMQTTAGGLKANFFHALKKVSAYVKAQHGTRHH